MTKPRVIPPVRATLVGAAFDDPDWLFEVKWDGVHVEAVVDSGKPGPLQRAARHNGLFPVNRDGVKKWGGFNRSMQHHAEWWRVDREVDRWRRRAGRL